MLDSDITNTVPLLTVCWYNSTLGSCYQADVPEDRDLNRYLTFKKNNDHQGVAVIGIPAGGALIAVFAEKGNYFEITHIDKWNKKLGSLKRKFNGCDATVSTSYVKPEITNQLINNTSVYCIYQICRSKRISNLQKFKSDKKIDCFTLNDLQ